MPTEKGKTMSKYIDADLYVEMQIYDDEHEEWSWWNGTIEELLDQWTEEGCPSAVDIVHCGECKCCRDELIEEYMPLYIYCEKWNHETDFDGFCKGGERIEE